VTVADLHALWPAQDPRRHFLAGYLSSLPEFSDRHPEDLLPVADRILAVVDGLVES
jgi:hypothetical protein